MRGIYNPIFFLFVSWLLVSFGCFSVFGQEGYPRENMGEEVNSPANDLLPRIAPDGKTLYFIRDSYIKNIGGLKGKQDVWFSRLLGSDNWSVAENIGPPINNIENNAVCSVSPDGNTLLLLNAYLPNGKMSTGASLSYRTPYGWSNPQPIIIKDFQNLSENISFCMGPDGKTLLLDMQGKDSHGLQDLYVCFKEDSITWSKPLNLGKVINTNEHDFSPFLAADNTTLYFASSGHGGYGSADLFMARRLDSTWTAWSKPVNLGTPINTEGFDAYFSICASGEFAYFSSETQDYGHDIFRVRLHDSLKPRPLVLVYGEVFDSKNRRPLNAEVTIIANDKLIYKIQTNSNTGGYQYTLNPGLHYTIGVYAQNYLFLSKELDTKSIKEFTEVEISFALDSINTQIPVRLNNIYFDFNQATLLPTSYKELDDFVIMLKKNPSLVFEVAGHTDNVGTPDFNQTLSEKRAQAVRDYLISKGISETRVFAKGYGATQPIDYNQTEAGRAQNRRVELRILSR